MIRTIFPVTVAVCLVISGCAVDLYKRLEAETGQATGWKMNGGLRLACNDERWNEVKRQATTAKSFGLEMHLLSPTEAQELWPLMTVDDVVGAAFLPTDGQANPTDITMALAHGARQAGATICEDTEVLHIEVDRRRDQGGRHVARSNRVQRRAVLRGPVDAFVGSNRRRQRAVGVGAAPVRHHRPVRSDGATGSPDAARPRPADVLQGGGRWVGDGRLRAEPNPVGWRRNPAAVQLQTPRRRLRPLRPDHGVGDRTRAGACRPPASTS